MFNFLDKLVVRNYTFSEVEKLVKESNQEISNIEIVDIQEDFLPKQVCLKINYNNSIEFVNVWVDYEENNGEKLFLEYSINKIKEYSVFKRKEKYELMEVVKAVFPNARIEINFGKDGNSHTTIIVRLKESKFRTISIYILNDYLISIRTGKFVNGFHSEKIIRPRKNTYFSKTSLKLMADCLNE